jgi:serine/threonine protein kinase
MMGGMGVVYFALDHGNDGRPVALKTFRPELLPDRAARDRFLREGTTWVELGSHPHIVRCYAVEYYDPIAFLVLELIAKEQNMPDASLRSWLITGHPLPSEQALLFALQIARGMQHATERIPGFVHRDLKPENILVGAEKLPGADINRLRVTDFGLATILQDEIGKISAEGGREDVKRIQLTHGIVGTPLYMAPEQWNGEPVGIFTDVYAFGCMLHEMLTGQHAAKGKTISELEASHTKGESRQFPAESRNDVIHLVNKCLAVNPINRYATWNEIIAALDHAYAVQCGKPVAQIIKHIDSGLEDRAQAISSYNAIGLAYLDMGKAEVAVNYFEKAHAITPEIRDGYTKSETFANLGIAYLNLGDVQKAISHFEHHLAIARETSDRRGEGLALNNLGEAFRNIGDANQAIRFYQEALAIYNEIGDKSDECRTLSNLGVAYKNQGNIQQAIEIQSQGLTIAREIGNRRAEVASLANLGTAYGIQGNLNQAIAVFEEAYLIAHEIGDRRSEGTILGNMGNAYQLLGRPDIAVQKLLSAITVSEEVDNKMDLAGFSMNVAQLQARLGNLEDALPMAQKAERIFLQIGHPEYAQRAHRLVAQLQENIASETHEENPVQTAFDAFQEVESPEKMQAVITHFPFMTDNDFIHAVERVIREQQLSPGQILNLEQRLMWLKQNVGKQKPGFLDRLFGNRDKQ